MGWRIRIREGEACDPVQPFLSPDLVIINNFGPQIGFDFALAEPDEVRNKKGLRAKSGLHTAIIIQLFSDRRAQDGDELPDDRNPDLRGWWGSSVDVRTDLGEGELGSRLWLLQRSVLTTEVVNKAREYCIEALQPILDQGAVASFDVQCEGQFGGPVDPVSGLLAIHIGAFSQSGDKVYAQKFQALWQQQDTLRRQGES